MRWRVPR